MFFPVSNRFYNNTVQDTKNLFKVSETFVHLEQGYFSNRLFPLFPEALFLNSHTFHKNEAIQNGGWLEMILS